MKSRKRIVREEKIQILKAVRKAVQGGSQPIKIIVETRKRAYEIEIKDGKAILPSGKAFKIDARHIC